MVDYLDSWGAALAGNKVQHILGLIHEAKAAAGCVVLIVVRIDVPQDIDNMDLEDVNEEADTAYKGNMIVVDMVALALAIVVDTQR